MSLTKTAWAIFNQSIIQYHLLDNVDAQEENPFEEGSLERILYSKNWIDTVQWHLEDLIRDENISPDEALFLKRRIDASNQKRTDLVEYIDHYFFEKYRHIPIKTDARLNTETPAWAFDRLSILALKIYHMKIEASREDAEVKHREKCRVKLSILKEQYKDLSLAIEQLLTDISEGSVIMKTYKQMKMYNDESLNPILYQKKKQHG
ncbi:DUF4254 domain-containing protein [Elizabethkingia argentiflava]|uniref:DUF4254 domain-containing protein n=1 Tax=Elizabethkingia argenteiflava TaxID=2681556 RepID=A0A845PV34_9FLAO|nr:DUF4254 domain-containing protein [Elizabethkingia argenteiflava]NAW51515.1 DUF4254 domain-containing protein [Elizabethkingia argenteiflava]